MTVSRYNHHFANNFGSCRLLAYARDDCRDRDVRVYQIPNEWDVVGVSDGTDSWVAPVVRGAPYFRRVDAWSILNDIREGRTPPKPEPIASGRRRVSLDDQPSLFPPPAPPRRRVVIEEPEPATQSTRRRRAVV